MQHTLLRVTRRLALTGLVVLVAFSAAACFGGGSDDRPTPTPTATATPEPSVSVLEGVFGFSFEHQGFYPDVNCPASGSPYWISWVPELDFAQRLIDDTGQTPFAEPLLLAYRVQFRGEVSDPGEYGHLGQYEREVVVHEIVSVTLARECDASAASALRAARVRWEASGLTSYEMRLVRHCECTREWAGPIDMVVEGNVATSALFEGRPAPRGAAMTINALFDAIDEAVALGVETEVSYDDELGFPTAVRLDLQALAVDGGLSLEVLELASLS